MLFILLNLQSKEKTPTPFSLESPGAYLMVGSESRLPGIGPRRVRARRSMNFMVASVPQDDALGIQL